MSLRQYRGPGRLNRRRFLGTLEGTVAGAVVLTVATACSGGNPAAPATSAPPSSATTAAAAAPAAATAQPAATSAPANGPATPIEIRFNGIDTNGEKVAQKWAADFGAKHNLKITTDFVDWASSFQKITTGIAGGIAPDVFGAGGIWIPVIVSKGGARALDSYLANYQSWADYYPATKKDVTWDGKVYGVPYEVDIHQTMAYRTSMFKKAGIGAAPATWDDAQKYAKELTQTDGSDIKVAGWNVPNNVFLTQYYEDAVYQANGNIFNADRTKPTNNTPECEAALSFLVWFVQNKTMPAAGMSAGNPSLNAFYAGNVAMAPLGPHDMENVLQYGPKVWADTEAGPVMKKVKQAQVLFVNKYLMFSKAKNPDAAWEVIQAIVEPAVNISIVVTGDLGLPVRKAMESAKLYQDPRVKAMIDNIQYGIPREMVPQSFDVQPAMSRECDAALRGAKTVKQALQDMDTAVAKILKG